MSGIAGIIRLDGGPVEPGLIEKMTGAMSCRGPDGINHWVNGPAALGQCMLRTTPESLEETQPLANEDESLVLVMDGWLSNWVELRSELLSKGARLRTRADAELVLRAYEVWGRDCLPHIDGDFAFAIWDARKREAFCARDRIGIKPFYYFADRKHLVFASEEDCLLDAPGVTGAINPDFVAAALVPAFGGGDYRNSWLEGAFKLLPGHTLALDATGKLTEHAYWSFPALPQTRFASDDECDEAFRSVLGDAVRSSLRSSRPPTLMLSGGIDSAAIAGLARGVPDIDPDRRLHLYSMVDEDDRDCHETRNIRAIVAAGRQHATLAALSGRDGLVCDADLKQAAWAYAHPTGNTVLVAAMMYLTASRAGHNVMLDGIDGDTATWTPSLYIVDYLKTQGWRAAWREARLASTNNAYLSRSGPLQIFARSAWIAYVPRTVRQMRRNLFANQPYESDLWNLAAPDFARDLRLDERLRLQGHAINASIARGYGDHHHYSLTQPGVCWGMDVLDPVAARYGVEPRHPWSDRRLLEFCLRLPLQQRMREGRTKFALRRAVAPFLPPDVAWHPRKDHVGHHLSRRLLECSRDELGLALREAPRVASRYLDPDLTRRIMQADRPTAIEADKALDLAALIFWLRRIENKKQSWTKAPRALRPPP